jgi:hypothetical protein
MEYCLLILISDCQLMLGVCKAFGLKESDLNRKRWSSVPGLKGKQEKTFCKHGT